MSRVAAWVGLLLACHLGGLHGSEAAQATLFTDQDTLELEMLIDLGALCRDRDQPACEDTPATLIVDSPGGARQRIPIQVKTRGRWRLDPENCIVPPMFLYFGEGTGNTLFSGQEMLPLTTHCRNRKKYESYVQKEYLAYRIYNLLTERSVRTRLVRVVYRKDEDSRRPLARFAFLSEHFDSMAERNGAEVRKADRMILGTADPMELATMDLFQFMIGHTDWSSVKLHNVVLIQQKTAGIDAAITAVPFDFDFSGLVSAHYATPPPALSIRSTRRRLYRGFCNAAIDWAALYARFQAIRSEVFALADNVPRISSSTRRSMRNYLNSFYDILDSPESRKRRIEDACRQPD